MSAVADDVAGGEAMSRDRRGEAWTILARWGAIVVLVMMIVVFGVLKPSEFLTTSNLVNVLNQSALGAIIAMGLTFALVAGDFDLSIGYNASLAGIIVASLVTNHGWALGPAILIALGISGVVGYVNGLLVTRIGINALIATLGMGTVVLGLNYAITAGVPGVISNRGFLDFSVNKWLGVPYPVYVMIGGALVLWLVLNKTVLGHEMQAVGGNRTAAEISGIRVPRVRRSCLVVAGLCAAVTGIMLASQSGSATVDGGQSYLLSAYAAAFFGSAVLSDGQFHIVGTLVGVLTVAVGFDGISLIGIQSYYQYVFQGGLLLFAVGVGSYARRAGMR